MGAPRIHLSLWIESAYHAQPRAVNRDFAESPKKSPTVRLEKAKVLIQRRKMPLTSRLSTPWVAGSNPAGIAMQTINKSLVNKGFLAFPDFTRYTP
jgi:hypothetical protein